MIRLAIQAFGIIGLLYWEHYAGAAIATIALVVAHSLDEECVARFCFNTAVLVAGIWFAFTLSFWFGLVLGIFCLGATLTPHREC